MSKAKRKEEPVRATLPNNSNQKRLYVMVRPDLARLFVKPNAKWHEYASGQFAAQIAAVVTDSALREDIIDFYIEHIDFFAHEEATVRISLEVGDLTAALANTLSFKMLQSGNVSSLFRLLARYKAFQEGLLAAPKRSTPASIEAARQSHEALPKVDLAPVLSGNHKTKDVNNTVKALYTVNRATELDIQVLMAQMRSKKMALIRDLIERAAQREEIESIRRFYEGHAENFEVARGESVPMRLNLPPEIDALHNLVAQKLFDSPRSKSKALRVIAGYYAQQVDAGVKV
jgi:hypothetical protein